MDNAAIRQALERGLTHLAGAAAKDLNVRHSARDLTVSPLRRLAELADAIGFDCLVRTMPSAALTDLEGGRLIAWHPGNACFIEASPQTNKRWRIRYLDAHNDGVLTLATSEELPAVLGCVGQQCEIGFVQDRLALRQLAKRKGAHKNLLRFLEWLRLERGDYISIFVYALVVGLLTLSVPVTVQSLFDIVGFGTLLQPLVVLGLLLIGALLMSGAFRLAQTMLLELVGRRFFMRAIQDFGTRLTKANRCGAPHGDYASLANRVFDAALLEKELPIIVGDGLGAVSQLVVGFTLLSLYHPWFLLFSLLGALATLALLVFTWRRGEETAIYESKKKHAIASWMRGVAEKYPSVRTAQGQRMAQQEVARILLSWHDYRRSHFSVVWRQQIGFAALQAFATALLLIGGGLLVMRGELTMGQLVAAEVVTAVSLGSLTKLGALLPKVYDAIAAMDKVGDILDLDLGPTGGPDQPDAEDAGISIRFGSSSLFMKQGEKRITASSPLLDSAVQLIKYGTRTSELEFRVMGEWAESALSEEEGLLFVSPDQYFPVSIRENMTLGSLDIESDQMAWAMETCGLQSVVKDLPRGIQTRLAISGAPLTASDLARLAVSRALLAPHRVIILDRVFDLMAPQEIDRCLDALWNSDKTILCIAASAQVGLALKESA